MTERRHYSGPELATLLRRVDDELGSDAVIVKADRVRSGGLAGFFAKEHYEVVAKPPALNRVRSSPKTAVTADVAPSTADEPIGSSAGSSPPTATLVASRSAESRPDVVVGAADPAPAGAGRSIQAALLDRADQVSTEELLVRAAETTEAARGHESFRSVLGRAMTDRAGEPPERTHAPTTQPATSQEIEPPTLEKPIIGLRAESVRPGERVIDPMPGGPEQISGLDADDAVDADKTDVVDGEGGERPSATRDPQQGEQAMTPPCPFGCGGHPSSPTWPMMWPVPIASSPWAGWPPPSSGPAQPPMADVAAAWLELRREIDETIGRRLDDIIGAMTAVTTDSSCGCGHGAGDDPIPAENRPAEADRSGGVGGSDPTVTDRRKTVTPIDDRSPAVRPRRKRSSARSSRPIAGPNQSPVVDG